MYLCTNYGHFYPNIRPTLGGALEAFPSQLQLTILVCLAVRVLTDSLDGGNPLKSRLSIFRNIRTEFI